jgi:hypothetical protein
MMRPNSDPDTQDHTPEFNVRPITRTEEFARLAWEEQEKILSRLHEEIMRYLQDEADAAEKIPGSPEYMQKLKG